MNLTPKAPQTISGDPQTGTRQKKVEQLLQNALDTFKEGNFKAAFDAASNAKAFRMPVQNVDYFRAACLLHLGRPFDAREALREELHYFPTNSNASKLLEEVLNVAPDTQKVHDTEFKDIYSVIRPHTMVPEARLYSIFKLAKTICEENIPGNFVECGVARGGTTLMLGLIIQKYSKQERHHFGFDSFEGMPEPSVHDTQNGIQANDTGWGSGTCSGNMETINQVADQLGVQHHITLVPGYFEDTLASWHDKVANIAFLHLDADWYTSTMTILDTFYESVVPSGYLQFDDYGCWDGCKKAVDEFQATHNVSFELRAIPGDGQGIWMQKR